MVYLLNLILSIPLIVLDKMFHKFLHDANHAGNNKTILPVPEEWKKHRLLVWIYWFAHFSAVNLVGLRHRVWNFGFLLHDVEKPFLISFMGYDYKVVNKLHKENAPHHIWGKANASDCDMAQLCCDWEASGFTKPDSLKNGVRTLKWFRNTGRVSEELYKEMLPYFLSNGFKLR